MKVEGRILLETFAGLGVGLVNIRETGLGGIVTLTYVSASFQQSCLASQ